MFFGGAYVLWDDPLILGCLGYDAGIRLLRLRAPSDILCFPSWNVTPGLLPRIAAGQLLARVSGKRVHFMRNSPQEDRLLGRLGIPGVLCSQNALVNEHVFRPTGAPKSFDAVYAAQMLPVKRMELARLIPSLYIVTYGDIRTATGEFDLARFEPSLSHAAFNKRWVNHKEVNDIYNKARVGLALSEREGAMLASIEYLLAGLPIVSTPSVGGRDVFFDDSYAVVAPPDAGAIAAAVERLARADLAPAAIRRSVLERIQTHRHRLVAYVIEILRRCGVEPGAPRAIEDRLFSPPEGIARTFVYAKDFDRKGWT